MVIGRLPFRTPYKEEFQRRKLTEDIKKGLTSMHEREMQHLSLGKDFSDKLKVT